MEPHLDYCGLRFTLTDGCNLLQRIDPEGREVVYAYDTDGRLISTTDGNGNVIEQEYDDLYAGCSSCCANDQIPTQNLA